MSVFGCCMAGIGGGTNCKLGRFVMGNNGLIITHYRVNIDLVIIGNNRSILTVIMDPLLW